MFQRILNRSVIAIVSFVIILLQRRKDTKVREYAYYLFFLSFSYVASNILICGFDSMTYSFSLDFGFIIGLTILLFVMFIAIKQYRKNYY